MTYEDSDRRTYDACRLLADPNPIPGRLHVLQAQGHPLFGVPEGAAIHSRPQRLPAWFQIWAQIRQAGIGLVIIDPICTAFMGQRGNHQPRCDPGSGLFEAVARHRLHARTQVRKVVV